MTIYNDIYVRDNFGDNGSVPSAGNPYQSPDIVPYQSGVLTIAQAIATYGGPDLGLNIVQQGLNNLYVRAKSLASANSSGTAALSYAASSLFLLPSQWVPIQTLSGASQVPLVDQSNSTTITPGEICLVNQAFVLTGLPSSNVHYCLVAVVQTPTHPVVVPATFPNNASFVSWVQNNPAVGWRNIAQVPNSLVQIVTSHIFGSTDPNPAYFYFQIKAPSGHNYATNTGVRVQCTDSRCPFNWVGTLPAPDGQGNQITGFQQYVPANITLTLSVTLTSPNGQPFPSGGQLSITYYEIPSSSPSDLEVEVSRETVMAYQHAGEDLVRETVSLIEIGEVWLYVTGS